jgi:hypothetical protein
MRPHIFVTEDKIDGLRSVDELREGIRQGHAKSLWETILNLAEADCQRNPITPSSDFPGREKIHIQYANPDWTVVNAAGAWVQTAALAALITGHGKYRDNALRQMETLFDRTHWPIWRDHAHKNHEADLRTGMLCRDLGLAYDWLYPLLNAQQRQWIVAGINDMGIQPYLRSVAAGAPWANGHNNWLTVVVGGLGICGMALSNDHPQSQDLIDFAHPRLVNYLNNYGPEGEFNESVAYANASLQPVAYFTAHRYHQAGGDNLLAQWPFLQTCYWASYFMIPPGHIVPFGDSHLDAAPHVTHFSAVADATQDSTLQWFYLQNIVDSPHRNLTWELLWYNASIHPTSPEGKIPRGRAFKAHSACISSRTSWNQRTTPCVVYGKGGHGAEGHGHHDAGQLCIDAYGERLITDLGSPPGYPADFFGPNRYAYYNASVKGHNVLTFNEQEMKRSATDCAEILNSDFDDEKGGHWSLNLTPLYDHVISVKRTVAFLSPNIVAVVDDAACENPTDIVLRWHTTFEATPNADGQFYVMGKNASLSGRVLRLDGDLSVRLDHHAYKAPFNRMRLGHEFDQRYEPFVEAALFDKTCRLLTLFAIYPQNHTPGPWETTQTGWQIDTPNSKSMIQISNNTLSLKHTTAQWKINL